MITGTDTDVGKTIFSAALMLGLEAAGHEPHYWKPVQSGIADVDTRQVQKISQMPEDRFFSEKYILSEPLSPHRAAEIDEVEIDVEALGQVDNIPEAGTLIIEGAGGLMVPMTRENLQINLYKSWNIPLILCARTGLGTINHTLLSLEAIWTRRLPLKGIVFIGEENEDNIKTIEEFSKTKVLGHLPVIEEMSSEALRSAFQENFNVEDFIGE